jgi:hypothetical protein
LQVRSLKALTAKLYWNDVIDHLGGLEHALDLTPAAKRVIP